MRLQKLSLALFALATPFLQAQLSVSLEPSKASPSPLATMITWTATASGAGSSALWYRFRARRIGQDFHTIRDYGPINTLQWTDAEHEGSFEIEASVLNPATGASAAVKARYQFLSNVAGDRPSVNATAHPLVFFYSAPPCEPGSRMRVRFHAPGGSNLAQYTPYKPCESGVSMNFYLAGMRAQTHYTAVQTVDTGSTFVDGPSLGFTTGKEAILAPAQTVVDPPETPAVNPILLQGTISTNVVATDLSGNLLWYYPQLIYLMTKPAAGGYFFGINQDPSNNPSLQIIRGFDVAGTTVFETNAGRVNQQLAALGKHSIINFHHEVVRLPDGNIMTLGSEERILANVQGPGNVDVIGDMIIVMNSDLQVVWTWDAFDFLDPKRKATLPGDVCSACATRASIANDWTHSNSLEMTADGNLLLSVRNQDWVIKIDYENGNGDGHILWRLGNGGDFQLNSADPSPWFSHQHDATFTSSSDSLLTLYDDGNLRQATDPSAHSRGQALRIDQTNLTADLILNADLGAYSAALGSAQLLPNGHYSFETGFLSDNTSLAAEVDPYGRIVYELHTFAQQYRSFRMRDLYTP